MTIENENRKISYDIDATSLFTFAYTFDIVAVNTVFINFFDTDGVEVVVAMVRTNSSSPAVNEYFVDEDNNQIVIGGTGFLQAQYSSDIVQLLITRTVDLTQEEVMPAATNLQSNAIETALDKNTMATQQVSEIQSRSLVIPIQDDSSQLTELPAAAIRANQFLAFDVSGNPTVAAEVSGSVVVSVAMQPVVAAATLAVARTLLDVYSQSVLYTQTEVDALLTALGDLKLSLAGGTMSGAIAMGTKKITGLGDPVADQDAATKNFVVDQKQETLGTSTTVDSEANDFVYAHAYSAPTDGYVTAWDETGGTIKVDGFVGGTDDPAGAGTNVAANRVATAGHWTFITFFVPKGQFWEVTTAGGSDGNATIRWQALGALISPVDQD